MSEITRVLVVDNDPEMLTATAHHRGRFARNRCAEPFEVSRSSLEVDRVLL